MTEATRSMLTRRSEAGTRSIDDPYVMGGWVAYGVGARVMSSVLYTIVPVLITEMAKSGGVDVAVLLTGVVAAIIPTSVPTLSYSASMLMQFLMALPIAGLADMRGWRLPLVAIHVAAGLAATSAIAASPATGWPVALVGALLALAHYTLALAWMLLNSYLPLIASSRLRSPLSLTSSAVCAIGGGVFLVLQYFVLASEPDASPRAMRRAIGLGAITWFIFTIPALICLRRVPEPPAADPHGGASLCERVGRGLFRLHRHQHTARFVLSQTLYLTGAAGDGAIASLFATEARRDACRDATPPPRLSLHSDACGCHVAGRRP